MLCMRAKLLQPYLILCDPMDCSPSGSSVHGILQARILEWVAMASSRGSSRPRDQTCVSYVSCTGRWVFFTKPTCLCCVSDFLKIIERKIYQWGRAQRLKAWHRASAQQVPAITITLRSSIASSLLCAESLI